MEVTGIIKVLNGTQNIGNNGFRKREIVITTAEQYPQYILIEFIQDKCELLDNYNVSQEVKVHINIRGREWVNLEGISKYFNAIQGWRIELLNSQETTTDFQKLPELETTNFNTITNEVDNDLPF